MYQTEKSSWWKHWDFIVLDIICLQIAYVISFMIRHGWIFPYKLEAYKDLGVIVRPDRIMCRILFRKL